MSNNPYAAPKTDVDRVEIRGERPDEVTYAVRLLWIGIALSAITEAVGFRFIMAQIQAGASQTAAPQVVANFALIGGLGGAVIGILLWAWLVSSIAVGRNWARWLFLVLIAIGVLFALLNANTTIAMYSRMPMIGISGGVNWILQLVACYLLLRPRAGAWFKAPLPA